MYIVRKPESIRSPALQRSAKHHVGRDPELLLVAAQAHRQLARVGVGLGRAAGSRGWSRRRRPRRRSAATTARRRSTRGPASGAAIAAPTTPASEIRLLALTRVSPARLQAGDGGRAGHAVRLGGDEHAERRREHRERLGGHRVGHQPAQERPQRHGGADRPAAAVAEPVEERARAGERRPRTAASSGRGRAPPGRGPRRAGRRTGSRPARSPRRRRRRR